MSRAETTGQRRPTTKGAVRAAQGASVAKLRDAIARREFHRLRPEVEHDSFPPWADVPEWVPRKGYAWPTRDVLRAVEAGLRRKL